MCEEIYPVKDRLYTPKIENADDNLVSKAEKRAKEIYGDPLPIEISSRLTKELSRIIGEKASYAVNYLLAEEIVKKANEDGYFVGSLRVRLRLQNGEGFRQQIVSQRKQKKP